MVQALMVSTPVGGEGGGGVEGMAGGDEGGEAALETHCASQVLIHMVARQPLMLSPLVQ